VIESLASWPNVDVVVAARDEEAVVARLMERLGALRYPAEQLTTWIVDDGSEDKTPDLLDELKPQYPNLNVIRRQRNAGGGKSGALNAALAQSSGEWILVLDADGQISEDQLERLIPIAVMGDWSGVQMRKAVTNADTNLLTRVQAMEMAFDALIQQGRLLGGGVSELRGNGQLLRRDVLEACGGFNEDTVTDDLDLSFRFLLQGARTTLLWNPPVREEAVETISALWKQRQRWAEGGLQRFFDYWPGLLSNRLTVGQRRDLACFFLLQYALPVLSFADLVTSALTRTSPVYWPLSIVAFGVSGVAYWRGCRRCSEGPALPQPDPFSLLLGIAYLSHWFFVIPWVTLRMAVLPKRLVWAKTSHRGTEETVKA
jgi:1,2-diacylglycerol 3-beta-glucosyltransferase